MSRAAVVAAGAASAFGFEWRGLGHALREGVLAFAPCTELAASHPGVVAAAAPEIPKELDPADFRAQKLMSRPARLAAVATRRAVRDAGWTGLDDAGFFLGVGASGGSLGELASVLRESMEGGALSAARFGQHGIVATNPVSAFHLLNNFTLCHAAILLGIGGPNGAFFSRGGGTVAALQEAIHGVVSGDCERALAGGADTAIHPVTYAELDREGRTAAGLVPGEGAAIVALAREAPSALAIVERCELRGARARPLGEVAAAACAGLSGVDLVVLAPWGVPARQALAAVAGSLFADAVCLDVSRGLGESLAASPALAWVAALDLIVHGAARRAVILSAGIDEQVGVVALGRPS